jgi:hypothetical protein
VEKYGIRAVETLENMAQIKTVYTAFDLTVLAKVYKEKLGSVMAEDRGRAIWVTGSLYIGEELLEGANEK